MSKYYQTLAEKLENSLAAYEFSSEVALSELTITINKDNMLAVAQILRDDPVLQFDTIIDVCGVDYSAYEGKKEHISRFASVYHLQSVSLNHRIRMVCYLDDELPIIDSVVYIWHGANWFERESFDMFGILYDGHPDLRRILTDYGFIGNPLRKDFPVIGNVEMRYDHELKRVIYEPVSIENRVIVPRIVRHDNRYLNPNDTSDENT
ncbi:MAG: NADH-quinone oxidoreductase subunit C [Pseudomonadota bacterium]